MPATIVCNTGGFRTLWPVIVLAAGNSKNLSTDRGPKAGYYPGGVHVRDPRAALEQEKAVNDENKTGKN